MGNLVKLVLCVWEDASDVDIGPWVAREGAPEHEATIFHQVGYIVDLTPDFLLLTHAVSNEQMAVRSRIPIGMVRRLVQLTEGEPVKIPKRRKAPK